MFDVVLFLFLALKPGPVGKKRLNELNGNTTSLM
jgi:hypothetical protein